MVGIISVQRENEIAGGCVVYYSWSPPRNININNISHFMVTFNGSNETVNKTEEAIYMREQSVCTCAVHNISIIVVDQCRRMGPSNDHMAPFLSGATCNDPNTHPIDPTNVIQESSNEGEDMIIIVVYLCSDSITSNNTLLSRLDNSSKCNQCIVCLISGSTTDQFFDCGAP